MADFPTGRTLLRVLAVARWLAWGWMVAVASFSSDALRQPAVAWLLVAAGAALAVTSTALVRSAPAGLVGAPFVVAEASFAIAVTVLDGWVFETGHVFVTSQSLATQWPLIATVSVALAAGPVPAAGYGLLVGPARWLAAVLNDFGSFQPRHVVSLLSISIFHAVCGAVFGWLVLLLRRAELEVTDSRARDEVAGVLHDTVLQTLALVERRVSDTDPDLARSAREADRDLRAFLFGGGAIGGHDLRSRVRAAVEQARRNVPAADGVSIELNVVDDGRASSGRDEELLARAIGEAVANALQHARASRVVVFVETADDGQVFASVRDDGIGFDPHVVSSGHGLIHSIDARMASIGGRVELDSAPGRGAEVRLWTR